MGIIIIILFINKIINKQVGIKNVINFVNFDLVTKIIILFP